MLKLNSSKRLTMSVQALQRSNAVHAGGLAVSSLTLLIENLTRFGVFISDLEPMRTSTDFSQRLLLTFR